MWMYGNLSPLLDLDILKRYSKQFVNYALEDSPVLNMHKNKKKIENYYYSDYRCKELGKLEKKLSIVLNEKLC